MTPNKILGKEFLPEYIRNAIDRIDPYFLVENTGLYIAFENSKILWPCLEIVEPFVVSRHDLERTGYERNTPIEVVSRLEEEGWTYYAWFPYEIAHGELNQFVLRYAHELQHYKHL